MKVENKENHDQNQINRFNPIKVENKGIKKKP